MRIQVADRALSWMPRVPYTVSAAVTGDDLPGSDNHGADHPFKRGQGCDTVTVAFSGLGKKAPLDSMKPPRSCDNQRLSPRTMHT
jgi:hypothetical protein